MSNKYKEDYVWYIKGIEKSKYLFFILTVSKALNAYTELTQNEVILKLSNIAISKCRITRTGREYSSWIDLHVAQIH